MAETTLCVEVCGWPSKIFKVSRGLKISELTAQICDGPTVILQHGRLLGNEDVTELDPGCRIYVLPTEPHGFRSFLEQPRERISYLEWPAAMEERDLEKLQLRLVVERADTYDYEKLLSCSYVPKFLTAELQGQNCASIRALQRNAQIVTRCGNWIIRPNPNYFDFDSDPKDLKFGPRGFRLVAWWIHPDLQKESVLFNGGALEPMEGHDYTFDTTPDRSLSDFRKSQVKYLMTWQDLGPEHLEELVELQEHIRSHLLEVYGVKEEELRAMDLQFHTTTAFRNPSLGAQRGHYMTAHLQIGVNHCWSLSCVARHKALQEIIDDLKRLKQKDISGLSRGTMPGAHVYFEERCFEMASWDAAVQAVVAVSEPLSICEWPIPTGYFQAVGAWRGETLFRTSDWAKAQQRSGLHRAVGKTSPVALVIFGPAGVGKSTVRRMLEEGEMIPGLSSPLSFPLDAVVVDGDLLREVAPHWTSTETRLAKQMLMAAAIKLKQNLVMVTCHQEQLEQLQIQGYVVHVLPVLCPFHVAAARGRARQEVTGRKSSCGEEAVFEQRVQAIFSMALQASGSVIFVKNTDSPQLHSCHSAAKPEGLAKACSEFYQSVGAMPVSWQSLCWLDRRLLAQKTRVGPLRRERRAVYLLGAPGVGKTSIWRQGQLLRDLGVANYVAIDGELFYEAHWGHQHCASHLPLADEMRKWKMKAFAEAVADGFNIVLPVTGTSPGVGSDQVAQLESHGYTVHVLCILAALDFTENSVYQRHCATGRPLLDSATYRSTLQLMQTWSSRASYLNNGGFQQRWLTQIEGREMLKRLCDAEAISCDC